MIKSSSGVARPTELAMLAETVDDFCAEHGIDGPHCREVVAVKVWQLFDDGITDRNELSQELDRIETGFG